MTTSISKQKQYKKAAIIPEAIQQKKPKASVDNNSEVGFCSHSSSLMLVYPFIAWTTLIFYH